MQIKKYFILFTLLILLQSCIEEFNPEVDKYDKILVVEGLISNEPGPYIVKLSLSTFVNEPEIVPLEGATVQIIDGNGLSETLSENKSGIYTTSSGGIQGEIGNKYKVIINTGEGINYESEFSKLLEPVGITSLNASEETEINTETNEEEIGYKFYVDTENMKNDSSGLLWRAFETYEYHADQMIYFIYKDSTEQIFNPDSIYHCWRTNSINQIYAYEGGTSKGITGYPLNFVSSETKKLNSKYSLLLKQYTINEIESSYWADLQDLNSEAGGLYTQQPYQIKGNVKNTSNIDDPVLGYFTVASVNEHRIFVDQIIGGNNVSYCEIDYGLYADIMANGSRLTHYITIGDDGELAVVKLRRCFDCTVKGGSNIKPEFWID